jgi:hypothetical protein
LNPSDKTRGTTYSDEGESKLKKYKWFILGGVIVVIVSVVLGVVLGGKSPGPGPNPGPPTPPHGPWEAFNPYSVSATHDYASKKIGSASAPLQTVQDLQEGRQKFMAGPVGDRRSYKQGSGDGPAPHTFNLFEVYHEDIPIGPNNQFIQHMLWEVGQLDTKVAYVTLENAIESRWSPPEDVVGKKKSDGYDKFRLDMCGLEVFENPFGF